MKNDAPNMINYKKTFTTRIKKYASFSMAHFCTFGYLETWFIGDQIEDFFLLSFERNPTSVALFVLKLYSKEGAGVQISKCSKREKKIILGWR